MSRGRSVNYEQPKSTSDWPMLLHQQPGLQSTNASVSCNANFAGLYIKPYQ